MKVLLFAPYFEPAYRGGGPIRTLSALVRTAPESVDLSIVTRDRDLGAASPLPVRCNEWIEGPNGSRIRYTTISRLSALMRALRPTRRGTELVYLNSFFDPQMAILPVLLHRMRFWGKAEMLLAPRGEFSEGALSIKAPKKRAYIWFFRLVASRSIVWHASGAREAEEIAAALSRHIEVLIREDETALPAEALCGSKPEPRDENDSLRVAFVSRISPKKGLTVLLEALHGLTAGVSLDIFGPEEDRREVEAAKRLAADLPASVSCRFMGEVEPGKVRGLFANYDLFAFPTAGENFGHVVAEALSAGCPVMITDTTPWTETIRMGGGVVVETRETADWRCAIQTYAAAGPRAWRRARLSAGEAYSRWAAVPKGDHVFDCFMRRAVQAPR